MLKLAVEGLCPQAYGCFLLLKDANAELLTIPRYKTAGETRIHEYLCRLRLESYMKKQIEIGIMRQG